MLGVPRELSGSAGSGGAVLMGLSRSGGAGKGSEVQDGGRHRGHCRAQAGLAGGGQESPSQGRLGPHGLPLCPLPSPASSTMSSESSKKRKPKVIRTDGVPAEGKRGKGDTDQVQTCPGTLPLPSLLAWLSLLENNAQRNCGCPTLAMSKARTWRKLG